MKIIAVGWNYLAHNQELNFNEKPEEPVIFMKPDTALLRENNAFYLPEFSSNIHYETEVVIRISRMGKNIAEKFASRYYDSVGLGIDFTARDLQEKLKTKGLPWEISKGFDNSAPVSAFVPISNFKDVNNISFSLKINGEPVQQGNTGNMIFKIDFLISHISKFFTLKVGDLIFTGTPEGVGAVKADDHLEGFLENEKMLDFHVH
jgi:2-keto-4-pentenoate hydratase/2-oxohepta-3-ene-1,7-dioic acid hydratase in catechol pathway